MGEENTIKRPLPHAHAHSHTHMSLSIFYILCINVSLLVCACVSRYFSEISEFTANAWGAEKQTGESTSKQACEQVSEKILLPLPATTVAVAAVAVEFVQWYKYSIKQNIKASSSSVLTWLVKWHNCENETPALTLIHFSQIAVFWFFDKKKTEKIILPKHSIFSSPFG